MNQSNFTDLPQLSFYRYENFLNIYSDDDGMRFYNILRSVNIFPANDSSVEIDYDVVLKKGFDEHAYYGTYINTHRDIWHIVGEYYFTISHKDEMRFLHIYKK